MSTLIASILDNLLLSNEAIEGLASRSSRSHLLPRIDARLALYDDSDEGEDLSRPVGSTVEDMRISGATGGLNWSFFTYATWYLDRAPLVSEDYGSARRDLYWMQRQVKFIVEDAWHERHLHLTRIARGMSDRLQIEILRERIAALDVVLEAWLQEPMETLLR